MLSKLVGRYFGGEPEKRISEIKEFKRAGALYVVEQTAMNKNDVVLEIGSGCGYMSCHVASRVKRLYCCDISKSFLEVAKRECREIDNISFHYIKPYSFSFDFLTSGAVDVVFSHNVFIHLNLFDIFWYLHEISRVIKPGGRLWFDIVDADTLDPQKDQFFMGHANVYKYGNIKAWPTLMKWNSASAIKIIAKYHGFHFEKFSDNKHFLFTKQ